MTIAEWPVYYKDSLIVGDQNSNVGVATLWTPREMFSSKLKKKNFKIIGQLYSVDGVNPLLRNVLANPTIDTIIICGQDKIRSADALTMLKKNGITKSREVIGKEQVKIDKEITRAAVESFCQNVQIVDMRNELNFVKIQREIDKYYKPIKPWAKPQIFPEPDIKTTRYPSEGSVYTYRGKTVAETWLRMLHGILRFGEKKKSAHTSGFQRELLNVAAVVTQECPSNIDWAEFFQFTKDHFEKYKLQIMTAKDEPTLSYTYGKRLRNHEGVDQVQSIIKKIQEQHWSRRAVGILWNVAMDDGSKHPPCLNLVHALVKDDLLYLTAYLRSNDIFRAWPENALALRTMQKEIADAVGVEMGFLTTISGSAHIYEDNFQKAHDILQQYYPKCPCQQDQRGNYVITVVRDKYIQVIHLNPSGRKIDKITGRTAMEIFNKISFNEGLSVFSHACDLGAELQKAEIAFSLGIEYTQDRPLDFTSIKKADKEG